LTAAQQNLKMQKWVATISVLLLILKFTAYYITHSVAILTDAMESIVNVVAGFIGLYSLYLSAKPRDENHPYGHGKAEFLSAAVEGTLILSAGTVIIYKSVANLITPAGVQQVDYGIYLVALSAVINYAFGYLSVRKGKKNNSLALVASGKHLISDSYSTFGIIAGLLLLYFTKQEWIDSAVAIVFGIIIIYTGYHIIRNSIAGIMDEADKKLLTRIVALLNSNRQVNWVDLHNLRIIKYGTILHLDCHLTVPWYLNVHEAHREIDSLANLVKNEFGGQVELFVHSDGCLPFSCRICNKTDCRERQYTFEHRVEWTLENILQNKKHQL